MRKYTILLVFLVCILFSSCSKSIYYAWEGETGGYCTLEVKKHQVIYRGSDTAYKNYGSIYMPIDLHLLYVCLYGNEKYGNNFEREVLSIDINDLDTRYIVLEDSQAYEKKPQLKTGWFMPIGDVWNAPNRSVSYIRKKNNPDTLSLVIDGVIRERKGNDQYYGYDWRNVQDSAMISKGIVWFPLEMYRVERIDYKKFGGRLQHL